MSKERRHDKGRRDVERRRRSLEAGAGGDEEDTWELESRHCDHPFLLTVVVVSYDEPQHVVDFQDKQHNCSHVVVPVLPHLYLQQ
ncbi:hypothetical protein Gohar_000676 [Gossypium harknessii]|uniref:Uncharacterized protein n=1 Tax=Gossypium harknessii TaxID=34285 RepID=A0A7J9I304_9ROSI|nr:hypothetical protein [Gossypium harknessii]